MTHPSDDDDLIGAVVAAGERLLSRRTGAPVSLSDPEDLGGTTLVLRMRVSSNRFLHRRSVVLKHSPAVGDPTDERFLREISCHQFTTALPADVRACPELIAYDAEDRILIVGDLGEHSTLYPALHAPVGGGTRDHDDVAAAATSLARGLGRLHAATALREDDFRALVRRMIARHGRAETRHSPGEIFGFLAETAPTHLADHLGIDTPAAVHASGRRGADLFRRGRHRAFSPAEITSSNIVLAAGRPRFLDFTWGGYHDCTLDLAAILLGLPTDDVPVRFDAEMRADIEDTWRAEVMGIWPRLDDDDYARRLLLDARMGWCWLSAAWYLSAAGNPGSLGENDDDSVIVPLPGRPIPTAARIAATWDLCAQQLEEELTRDGALSADPGVLATAEHCVQVAAALRTLPEAQQ